MVGDYMYSWIENIILGLKENYSIYNIYDLYDELGIMIKKLDPNSILLQGNEAFYHRDYFQNEIVFMRNDLCEAYEKFILAHELGHALLHTHVYEAAFNKNLLNIGKFEKQANYFAFKLLDVSFDPVDFDGFSMNQIASSLNLSTYCLECVTD